MCWNADISFNTFIFGTFSLLFLVYVNTFSKYGIPALSNVYLYLFGFEVIVVQLWESLLWKNLDNKPLNKIYTNLIHLSVGLQPPTLAMLIKEPFVKNTLLGLYGIFLFVYFAIYYFYGFGKKYTSVATNGHLIWGNTRLNEKNVVLLFMFLTFYLVVAYFVKNPLLFFIIFISLVFSLFFYLKTGAFGTMWCWISNSGFLVILAYILIVLPFFDNRSLC